MPNIPPDSFEKLVREAPPLGNVPISEIVDQVRGIPYWVLDGKWTEPVAAICQHGGVGIVTHTKDGVYHGRYIWPMQKFGDPWQSKAPLAMFPLEYHDPDKEQPT